MPTPNVLIRISINPPSKSTTNCAVPAEAYVPQPGDIMLRLDSSVFWHVTHYMAGAFDPNGSGIVFARRRQPGRAGGGAERHDVGRHAGPAAAFEGIRRRGKAVDSQAVCPLTPEQSCRLTEFAMAQDGKASSPCRTRRAANAVFRSRGRSARYFIGKPKGDRASWFCSELVSEACVAAGLLDPERTRPFGHLPARSVLWPFVQPLSRPSSGRKRRLASAGAVDGLPVKLEAGRQWEAVRRVEAD